MRVLLLILIAASGAMAQSNEPFRGANTIIFKTELSDDQAFDRICKALTDHAYVLDKYNRDFYQVKTSIKSTQPFNFHYSLVVNVSSGNIRIRPVMHDEKIGLYDWTYRKSWATAEYDVHKQILQYFASIGELAYAKD
jgi:hypothetical protein